jgi:M6 family metalloprotease-like protein
MLIPLDDSNTVVNNQVQLSNQTALETGTGATTSITPIPPPGFEEGYELAPPAPEITWEEAEPDLPHAHGIPPITDRYTDPAYQTSLTRSGGPVVVNETVLMIQVNFSDVSPVRPVSELEMAIFNTTPNGNSVHNYYKEVSYGVVNIIPGYLNGTAGGNWLSLPQSRKFYGQDKVVSGQSAVRDDGTDQNSNWLTGGSGKGQFVKDALAAANKAGVDFGKYDNDGPDGIPNSTDDDGIVDHVLILFSGNGQNHYGTDQKAGPGPDDDSGANDWGRDLLWPSRVSAFFGTFDGKNVWGATINPEDPNFTIPVGVTCHEFGHDMGLPDLYNITSGNTTVGNWELMDVGNYNTNSSGAPRPAHMNAWCKQVLGWIEPVIINETNNNQGVHQVNQTTSATPDSVCYRVNIEGDNEYYLIENRNRTVGTFEEALPDRGILIWHVDDDMVINRVIPPGNPYYGIILEDYKNDLNEENFISSMNTASWRSNGASDQADFNVTTTPNSSANGGKPSGIYIDRIKDNALWNMTVRILVSEDSDPPGMPQDVSVFDAEFDNGHIINLTWNASPDDGGSDDDVLYYDILINNTGSVENPKTLLKTVDATDATSYSTQVTGLVDGIDYNFTVLADDGPNVSPSPGNFIATPIDNIAAPPTDINAIDTFPDDGENITITWTLSMDDPNYSTPVVADIVGYSISVYDKFHIFKYSILIGEGNSSINIGNLTNGEKYYFRIAAVDDVDNYGYGFEVNATPIDDYIGSPINLQVTPSSWSNVTSYLIQWINPSDNAAIIEAYYKLDSPPTSNTDYTGNVTWYGVYWFTISESLTDGTHLVYVWLRDSEGYRNYTTAKFVTIRHDKTAPGPIQNLAITPNSWSKDYSFTASWNNPMEISGIKGVLFTLNNLPVSDFGGYYQSGTDINQLIINTSKQGENTLYLWLLDRANNADHSNNISINFYYDPIPPKHPLNLKATPSNWTGVNSFNITWTNPSDLSGIIGAWYKMDSQPFDNDDGTYVPGKNISSIENVKVSGTGIHTFYVWLVDNTTNTNYLYWNYTFLYYDETPPDRPYNIQTSPSYWTTNNSFGINWSVQNNWDQSPIGGVYYKFNEEPTGNNDGVFVAGFDIDELFNITVPRNGTNKFYFWLEDAVGNVNYQNHSSITLYYDALAPEPPVEITSHPTNIWTSKNNFTVSWTNPDEYSGIAGAYYKIGSPPTHNTDGIYIQRNWINHIDDITVPSVGAHSIYIWLKDRIDNVNYLNWSRTDLLFDDQPPEAPLNLTVKPSTWTSTNEFNITWTNPSEHSGIYGLYYWLSPPKENIGSLIIQENISCIPDFKLPSDDPPSDHYTIYIWLIDNAYNLDYRNNASQDILFDVSAPLITHTRVNYATLSYPVTLTAIVEDQFSGVQDVNLYYKTETMTKYSELEMEQKGGSVYQVEIPAKDVTEGNIGYFIEATDNSDNPNIRYYGKEGQVRYKPNEASDIDVLVIDEDMIPPTIIHQKLTSGIVGTKLAVTATVTDDGSGVSEVKVFYKSRTDKSFTEGLMKRGKPYFYELPEYIMTSIGVEYYLYAVDNSPRSNEIYFGNYGQTTVKPITNDSYIRISVSSVDDQPPKIIYGPEVQDVTSSSAAIYWITDEPSDSNIEFDTDKDLTIHGFNHSFVTVHNLYLNSLTHDTLYYYRISSTDRNDNGPTVSNIFSFHTTKVGEEDFDGDNIPDDTDPDDDNDNIPDSWEVGNKMNPKNPTDKDFDLDNDGYSNFLEYLADTDPNDPLSTPATKNDLTPPYIEHHPRTNAEFLEPLTISAKVTDNGSGVNEVFLFLKKKDLLNYNSYSMVKKSADSDIYSIEVSREFQTKEGLEYYIKASDNANNTIYYGKSGLVSVIPNIDTDIDVTISDKSANSDTSDDDSEGDIFEEFGEPYGLTHPGICLMVIIIIIVLIICFALAIRSALHARAMASHSVKSKSETADGERVLWEGDEVEELDEVEDLTITGDEEEQNLTEGL